jgi:Ca-activated chloride channel family protein
MKTFLALLGTMIFLSSFTPFEKESKESREGRQKYEEGDMEQAQEQFEKASKRLKKSPQAYFDLGNARLKAGKNEEALDAYRKSLETGKADRSLRSGIYHNMGNTFAKMSKLNDAEKMFVKSLIEEPSKESAENLEIVRRMIKQQEQQKKDQQKKDQEQKEKEDQEKKDEQDQQDQQKQDEQSEDQKQNKEDQPKEDKEQEEQKSAEKKEEQEKEEQEKKQASAAKKDEKKDDDEKEKGQLLQQFKQRKNLQISPFMLQKENESDSGQTW